MQEKTIVKMVRAESPFKIILRETLQDTRLSLKALGALCRLISQPGDWTWELWYLEKEILKVGRDARKKIFAELEITGYLMRSRCKDEKGQWLHSYQLFAECRKEKLNTEDKPRNGKSSDGKAVDGEAADGKGVDIIHNTDLENTELENTQPQQPAAEAVGSGGNLIFDKTINQNLHQTLADLLSDVEPILAQQMLDTLAGMGDKVKSPLRLLKSFVNNHADFDLTPGLTISKKRQRVAAETEKSKLELEQKNRPRKNRSSGKISAVDYLKAIQ